MQRDKIYGALILAFSALLLIYLSIADWAWLLCMPRAVPKDVIGFTLLINWGLVFGWEWYVIFPLWLVTVLIFGIAAWIGWTMMTTPPPVPLEELEELGLDDEEETA
ncbi:MAG: hypothetical protein EAX96_11465 [Candidatus Lokiarchaeota archaeon]|nr:hypothetical protein [Candidatus Lokiarchaeota archaeon]